MTRSIKAPVAGSISERLVQPGEFIRENTQVVTIVQLNPLKLRTSIQEKFAAHHQAGPGGRVRRRGLSQQDVRGQGRLRQPVGRSGHADVRRRGAGRQQRSPAEARVLRERRRPHPRRRERAGRARGRHLDTRRRLDRVRRRERQSASANRHARNAPGRSVGDRGRTEGYGGARLVKPQPAGSGTASVSTPGPAAVPAAENPPPNGVSAGRPAGGQS